MAWLTEQEFRVIYVTDSATEIQTEQIDQCLDEAIDELTSLCDETSIVDVVSDVETTPLKTKQFRRAQGKLAYRALLLIMSSRFRSGGILSQERDMNSSATDTYERFSEVEKRRGVLYEEALGAISAYLTTSESGKRAVPQSYSSAVKVINDW